MKSWPIKLQTNRAIFVVITLPADGLAPLGAKPSADTVMTPFVYCICTWPALEVVRLYQLLTFPQPGTSTPLMGRGISILLTEPYRLHSSRTSSRMSENTKQFFRWGSRAVSRFQILRGKTPSISQERGLCPIQIPYKILSKMGGVCPQLSPKCGGQVVNFGGNPPTPRSRYNPAGRAYSQTVYQKYCLNS